MISFFEQIEYINSAIDAAPRGSHLHGLPHVSDPSNGIVEVLIKCMEWNLTTRRRVIPESELPEVHQSAVDLLESLKKNLPDKCGEATGWNFEKAHSILHKVREIVLWGNTDNTSCQGAEHAHIELIKSVAHLTNNKDVFMCILRFHTRVAFLQHYERLLDELKGYPDAPDQEGADRFTADVAVLSDRNFNVACETGIRYPTLPAMLNSEAMHFRVSVRLIPIYTFNVLGYPCIYHMYMWIS